jgi:hypothetical protein
MKYSWPRILSAFGGALLMLATASARLMASPVQVAAETLHVKPRTVDQQRVANAITAAADSGMLVVITAPSRLAEFRTRQRRGVGRFITDSVLWAERALPLKTVLRTHLLGIGRTLDTQRLDGTGFGGCTLDVFVNGTRATDSVDDIRTINLAGVEYYDRFSVPPPYNRASSQCDALLLWTR